MDLNPAEFDQIAREVFAPVYPVIADQIKNKTCITKGICLDIGGGSGYLGIALAKVTELHVYLFDKSPEMLEIAARTIAASGLDSKIQTLPGDVRNIPFDDQSIDLVVSRGSIFFWENRPKAFKEIYRVLSPGGCAYIGGGFGTPELQKQITEKMLKNNKDWLEMVKRNTGKHNEETFKEELCSAGIPRFEIIRNEKGLWIFIRRVN